MEALKIDRYNCVVYDFKDLTDFLLLYIQRIRNNNAKMLSESALLYIFSIISEREETEEEKDAGMGIACANQKVYKSQLSGLRIVAGKNFRSFRL